jgi:hypothetical protein
MACSSQVHGIRTAQDGTMLSESACGPVAVLVFKTSERGDELRWWVRLPRALANVALSVHMLSRLLKCCSLMHLCLFCAVERL